MGGKCMHVLEHPLLNFTKIGNCSHQSALGMKAELVIAVGQRSP